MRISKKTREWITWILQTLTYLGGLGALIREMIPKVPKGVSKGLGGSLFNFPQVDPNINTLIIVAIIVVIISGALKFWNSR